MSKTRDAKDVTNIPFEADKIRHSTNRKVRHDEHAAGMNLVDGGLPVGQGSPLGIEHREIKR